MLVERTTGAHRINSMNYNISIETNSIYQSKVNKVFMYNLVL